MESAKTNGGIRGALADLRGGISDRAYGYLFGKLITPNAYPSLYEYESKGDQEIRHFGGVAWHDAPVPPKGHTCFVQTEGWITLDQVQRCACGAIRRNGNDMWIEVNSR